MKLLKYLTDNFYTKQQLCELAQISTAELEVLQQKKIMPQCSYKITMAISCQSFLADHLQNNEVEYYAKNYLIWLERVQSNKNSKESFSLFSKRYTDKINGLKQEGFTNNSSKFTHNLSEHIKTEWQYFLDGIYGLCTRTGSPEDIATKEFAVEIITELIVLEQLTTTQRDILTSAVNLLDKSSAEFAPHELINSSRQRLINDVRVQYQLPS